jgi:hypothetical protein
MRLLSPFYKKPYDSNEFNDDCDDEDHPQSKKFSFNKDTLVVGSTRMSAMQALTHPWMVDISEKLISDLCEGTSQATNNFTKKVLKSI